MGSGREPLGLGLARVPDLFHGAGKLRRETAAMIGGRRGE